MPAFAAARPNPPDQLLTALVDPRPGDPDQRVRQETYLRALATIPNLSITLAVIVSNDSDLLLPIRFVAEELGKPVGLLNPQRKHPSVALSPHVTFIKQIRAGELAKSQFPATLTDRRGSFSKPPSW